MAGRVTAWQRMFWSWVGVCAWSAPVLAYDFAYRLSGDRRVAPMQVFDDGSSTWLQFQAGQALPAIFDLGANGEAARLLSYVQQGPYVVLNGTASGFLMRIGDVTARAEYQGKAARKGIAADRASLSSQWAEAGAPPLPATSPSPAVSAAPAIAGASSAARAAALSSAHPGAAGPQVAAAGSSVRASEAASPAWGEGGAALEFDAALSDGNMRRVLERWARQAGWMFNAEHWTVDVDIPLVGAASFGADFRNAVRGLLSATELTERPLQPCFYANRVVRVVAFTQSCNPTLAPGAHVAQAS